MTSFTPGLEEERPDKDALPDALPTGVDYVRTIPITAKILGIGEMSLRAIIWRGDGPKVTRLSARRIGVRDSDREAWLKNRNQPLPA
jgi:hypothetical protein